MITIGEIGARKVRFTNYSPEGRAGAVSVYDSGDYSTGSGFEVSLGAKAVSFVVPFGGENMVSPCKLDEKLPYEFENLAGKYPLYAPYTGSILRDAFRYLKIPAFVFFDTSFFNLLPEEDRGYALPLSAANRQELRKSGAHGIFHEYAGELSGKNDKTVSFVLDKKTTVSASYNGLPKTISLGLTPLEGIMSLNSSGDIDPGIAFYLMKQEGLTPHGLDELLNKKSGFLGLTGNNFTMKEFAELRGKNNKIALAFEVYKSQILKYFGEAVAVLNGVDSIVFSGSNISVLQGLIVELLKQAGFLGITLKELPWENNQEIEMVSAVDSKVSVFLNRKSVAGIVFEKTLKLTCGPNIQSLN